MALTRALVTIPMVTGNPDDVATNTLHFDILDGGDPPGSLTDAVEALYVGVAGLWSNLVATTGWLVEWYRLSDPTPRRPIAIRQFSITTVGTSTLPTECACVLSFQAEPVSGLPQSRRRNRIYIGPLSEAMTDTDGRITQNARNQIAGLGGDLLDASDASAEWTWATYSPTDGTGADVASGWVDNAFDTQRRRGLERTTRTVFP